ncbi:MAG: hypothetical protein ACRENC_01490, partial [Gemmatimonadaceae bacterium]
GQNGGVGNPSRGARGASRRALPTGVARFPQPAAGWRFPQAREARRFPQGALPIRNGLVPLA